MSVTHHETRTVQLDDLKPAPYNPRRIDRGAAAGLRASLDRWGVLEPIVWNERTGHVVGGHQRLDQLRALGAKETTVVVVDLDESEERAANVSLNNPGIAGEFTEGLPDLLGDIRETIGDDAFAALKLDGLEGLDTVTTESEASEPATEYEPPPPPADPVTKPGEVVTLGPHTLHCADCLEVMRGMAENSVDAIVTDPPYGIGFMGKAWDCAVPGAEFAAEALRVLKPGGHLIAFAATRTVHRLTVAIEDAGFEIRDLIGWLQWQGFPKSLDVSKAIDKAAGAEREIVGKTSATYGYQKSGERWDKDHYITAPATPEAQQWDGWGTALKPAQEPAVLARKPLEGTVAANVLKWGTGALNIDACRYAYGDGAWPGPGADGLSRTNNAADQYDPTSYSVAPSVRTTFNRSELAGGRWPANIYACPKPSRREREEGCDDLPARSGAQAVERTEGSAGMSSPRAGAGRTASEVKNAHPTVKPRALMAWLLRLVSPPGAVVLEPFAGSGTTLVAAEGLDLSIVAVELDPGHCDIIRARAGAIWPE